MWPPPLLQEHPRSVQVVLAAIVPTASGAKRGLIAGLIVGAAILLAHEIHGATAKAELPEPAVLLVVLTALPGTAFGGWLRGRMPARASTD